MTGCPFADADLPTIDPFKVVQDEATNTMLADMAATSPVTRSPHGALVLRHGDVRRLATDRRLEGPGGRLLDSLGLEDGPLRARLAGSLLFQDGENHQRLRSLVIKAFTPKAVESIRPFILSVVDSLIDQVYDDGQCEAVEAICSPLPVPIVCRLMGIPDSRWEDFSEWARLFVRAAVKAERPRIIAAMSEMDDYLGQLVDERQAALGDDLLSELIRAEVEGDRLTRVELFNVVFMLLLGSIDQTRNQLSFVINEFAKSPNQWNLLRNDETLVEAAAEESMRRAPSLVAVPRRTTEPTEVAGVLIPDDTVVFLYLQAANSDRTVLDRADELDIQRDLPPEWRAMTFGAGAHYCIGASLARATVQEMLRAMSRRFPVLRLAGQPTPLPPGLTIAGFVHLPIAWTTDGVA